MNRSRITGDLTASGLLYADIANDRVGIGSTIPGNKLSLPDGAKIGLGNAEDITLWHDGTHGKLISTTGYFSIGTNDFSLYNAAANSTYMVANNGDGVDLYFNGNKKFETTNTGATVTGDVAATTGTFGGQVKVTSSNASTVAFSCGDAGTGFYNYGTNRIAYSANGTAKWYVESNGNTVWLDDSKIFFGTGSDFRFWHDGSDNHIWGTGAHPIKIATNGLERLRIHSSGRLDILGDGQNAGFTLSNAYGQAGFFGGMYYTSSGWVRNAAGTRKGAGMYINTGGHIAFLTSTETSGTSATVTETIRIDSDGRLLIKESTNSTGAYGQYATLQLKGNSTNTNAAILLLANGKNTTANSSGDHCGYIVFGDKQAGEYAYIRGTVDASPAVGDYPGRITFHTTADGAGSASERLRITSAGLLLLGTTDTGFSTGFTNMTIGNTSTANTGLTIASSSSNGYSRLHFADGNSGTARYAGWIAYNHADDEMMFSTGNNGSAKITIGTGSNTITGGTNLAIQNLKVKGIWSGSSSIGKEIELISGYDSSVKMVAIGYNLTDTGTGSTYGGDLVFHTQPLYSSPTTPIPESMRISSSGYVTKPKTPYFHVQASPSISNSPYDNGVKSFSDVRANNGSHYNNSTGVFTCPVAGFYFFSGALWSGNSDANNGNHYALIKRLDSNGNNEIQIAGCNHHDDYGQLVMSVGYYCAKGDKIFMWYNGSIRGSTPRNYFSGCLIG